MSAGELAKRGSKLADFGMSRQGTLMRMSSANIEGDSDVHPPRSACSTTPEKHDENFYELADIYALELMIWEGLYYVRHGEAVSCAQTSCRSATRGKTC